MEREVSFEVDCKNVVTTNKVILKDVKTGKEFSVPAKEWRWRNSWYADVTFTFRGQKYTVCAEVDPVIND